MTALVAALGAGVGIAGLFLVLLGLDTGDVRRPRRSARWQRLLGIPRGTRVRIGVGLLAGLAVLLLTGFVPALVILPGVIVVLPGLLRAAPQSEIELMEALDRWVRLLAASVGTGKSVVDALRSTRSQLPPRLATHVRVLIARLDARWPLPDALQAMADEVDSADADQVLAALILVGQRGGIGASATLTALSDGLQDRLRAAREIAAERAKPQIVVRQVTLITLVVLAAGMVFAPGYFAAYRTPTGQALALLLAAGYLGSLAALRRLNLPRRRDRILVRSAAGVMANA